MMPSLRYPITVFVAQRAAMALVGWLGLRLSPQLTVPTDPRPFLDTPALDALFRWDVGWYAKIAAEGYSDPSSANFWPLFPMLGRAVSMFGVSVPVALVVVAAVIQLAGLIVLYRLFSDLTDEQTGRLGLLLYASYPFAFFQAVPYPEGLTTCMGAAAVLCAMRRAHLATFLCLGGAVLSRHVGAFAAFAVLPALWHANRHQALPRRVLSLWPLLAVPVAVLMFSAVLQSQIGNASAFVQSRENWGPMSYWSVLEWSAPRTHLEHHFYIVVSGLLAIGALPLLHARRARGLAVMSALNLLLLWAVGVAALGRYSSSVWPCFLGLAIALRRFPSLATVVLLSGAATQVLWFHLYAHAWWVF